MPIWTSERDIGTTIETVVEINSIDSKWKFKANTILKTKYQLLYPYPFSRPVSSPRWTSKRA